MPKVYVNTVLGESLDLEWDVMSFAHTGNNSIPQAVP